MFEWWQALPHKQVIPSALRINSGAMFDGNQPSTCSLLRTTRNNKLSRRVSIIYHCPSPAIYYRYARSRADLQAPVFGTWLMTLGKWLHLIWTWLPFYFYISVYISYTLIRYLPLRTRHTGIESFSPSFPQLTLHLSFFSLYPLLGIISACIVLHTCMVGMLAYWYDPSDLGRLRYGDMENGVDRGPALPFTCWTNHRREPSDPRTLRGLHLGSKGETSTKKGRGVWGKIGGILWPFLYAIVDVPEGGSPALSLL